MRIEDIKKIDTHIHAFLRFNSNADKEKGFPVAIKDNFNTLGLETTAASNILKGYIPPYDATVVRKLREAGAVIVGKTNMDAFAHGASTEASDFGPTSNPWNLDYLAGGSSGGSAAAVAGGEVAVAIGSETAGSIRGPAAWCGVVGFKPTYGRVSRYGLIAMASSTDSPGPLAKTVADAKFIYEIIAGFDPRDATTTKDPKNINAQDIKKIKIGLPRQYFRSEAQKEINEQVLESAKVLEKLGAKLVDIDSFDPKYAISVYTIVMRSEVSSNLARFDGIRFGHTRDSFNEENKRRIMLGTFTLSSGYYDAYYKRAQLVRTIIIEDFKKIFSQVDLILSPTMPSTAPKKGITAGQAMYGEIADILSEPSSLAGLPAISIPCGFIDGLPVGMQLIGPQWSEDLILSVAQRFEENTDWHLKRPNTKLL
ncbi:Asp-tRNA(Asn)/Glu-tRNA(Gln) amidotransferase subunit GatA [Candidatus Gottesmanbacteria bacterium]|nr:Asp-tRNA(Asn)/Glu-tRNA(Gln) amidotransferase subunit GatA [Candidatus Gottesmanbacteria bacterium]